MKRKVDFLFEIPPPVKLYLDDVDDFIYKIQSVCEKIEFSTKDYEFESLEELKNNSGKKIKELTITGISLSPWMNISISVKKFEVHLSTHGKSEAIRGLWHSLRSSLQKKSGWYSRFLIPWFWAIILMCSVLGMGIYLGTSHSTPSPKMFFLNPISASAAFLLILSFLIRWKGSTIYLKRRHLVPGFWTRNLDDIIKVIIGAAIGVGGTLLSKYLFK